MYASLNDWESVNTKGNLEAEEAAEKEKNYKWTTEEKNGVRYNRLDKVTKPFTAELKPDKVAAEKIKDEKRDLRCSCCFPNQIITLVLIVLLFLASISFSAYVWYRCARMENHKEDKILQDVKVGELERSLEENKYGEAEDEDDALTNETVTLSSSSGPYFPS